MNPITLPKSIHREGRKGRKEQLYESLRVLHSSAFQVLSFVLIRVYPRRSAIRFCFSRFRRLRAMSAITAIW
jgi:hypothetical protein